MAIQQSTIRRLASVRKNYDSIRSMARDLQMPHGVLSDILAQRHAHVSWRQENAVRGKIGLEPVSRDIELLPDERIIRRQPPHKRDTRRSYHAYPDVFRALNELRVEHNLTQEEFLIRTIKLWEKYGMEDDD